MKNKILLKVGDWSEGGHGKTEDVFILTNLNISEIEKAYKAGTKYCIMLLKDMKIQQYLESILKDWKN